jgi:hypothetical protein
MQAPEMIYNWFTEGFDTACSAQDGLIVRATRTDALVGE